MTIVESHFKHFFHKFKCLLDNKKMFALVHAIVKSIRRSTIKTTITDIIKKGHIKKLATTLPSQKPKGKHLSSSQIKKGFANAKPFYLFS